MSELVLGIDLGTTNSSVAIVRSGRPELLLIEGDVLLPSVVGKGPDGTVLVGSAARNQQLLYPERTIRSVKRRMGEDVSLALGDDSYNPIEVSAMILGKLKAVAEEQLGQPVRRAVVTVPAYFTDAQRTATRAAGEVAGLTVERILNEPTAAALCYGLDEESEASRSFLVYDLGGGTFDVSIVRATGDLTEVLSSHGDTALGGDDFDDALLARLRARFERESAARIGDDLRAKARLRRLAEDTKIRLSTESYVRAREEHLTERDGVPVHLDLEVSREELEELIRPLVERTKDSVHTALREAGLLAHEIDEVVLVGGSTRVPLVQEMLADLLDVTPRMDVDPVQAVALGAALQGARIAGDAQSRILVDVTPFTFGTSCLGELHGFPSIHLFSPIIKRNTALPTRQTKVFYTAHDGQEAVDVHIFQGESQDSRDNLLLGRFMVKGLDTSAPEGSPIIFDLSLDLDGILHVSVSEKHTGLSKAIVIEGALAELSSEDLERSRRRVLDALGEEDGEAADDAPSAASGADARAADDEALPPEISPAEAKAWTEARRLGTKATRMLPGLAEIDREEVREMADRLEAALEARDFEAVRSVSEELSDVLFYLE